jgi:hypothetical protein
MKDRLKIRTLLLGGYTKASVARDIGRSKELIQYHAGWMEKEEWIERVKGSKNPIQYKRGPNPYPDMLSLKPNSGCVGENREHNSVNNFHPTSTGIASQIPSFDKMVKNWEQASVKSLHMECRVHHVQIGVPILKSKHEISSLSFIDSKHIVIGNGVIKYTGVLEFNNEESYKLWFFSDKKLIIHLPTETVGSAQQLRDWNKRAFRHTKGICEHLTRDHGLEFGEPYRSKVHFSFPDNEDLMWFSRDLQISTPDCWTDSSQGKVEFETNKMEIALAFFEMPLRIIKLEKEMEELKGNDPE